MRDELPELGQHRSVGVGEAIAHGLTQKSLRRSDLRRPFWGVRALDPVIEPADLVRQYGPRVRSGQVLAEAAAARLHGLPLPVDAPWGVQLLVPKGAYRPAARGVSARSIAADHIRAVRVHGLPVADPILTWLSLARALDVPWLVAIGDALVTGAGNYPGLRFERPTATIDQLHAAVDGWRGMAGIARLRLAVPLVRTGVESPWESITRLVILDGGLPEPEINGDVVHEGRFVARPDLLYPDERVAIQYDGDGHRTERSQWQADVARDERLRAAGWQVIHVTHETLQTPWVLHAAISTALARRS